MATVTGFTAARMLEIEQTTIVDGDVVAGDLILKRRNETTINAGSVIGPTGPMGPTGEVPEAPSNGHLYVRKDEGWFKLSDNVPPVNSDAYVLKNGEWTQIEDTLAPANGMRYVLKDGVWVILDRPWKLEFTDTDTLPTGFTVPGLFAGAAWMLTFTGSGHVVHYGFDFRVSGSYSSTDTRINIPLSLRPIADERSIAYFYEEVITAYGSGVGPARILTNGNVLTPVIQRVNITEADNTVGGGDAHITNIDTGTLVNVQMAGTYIRSSVELPSGASYI